MEVRNGKLYTVGSVLAGGLLGAGVALLLAPQSGKRTRREIRYFGQRMSRDVRRSLGNIAEGVSGQVQDGMGWAKKATGSMHHLIGSGKSKAWGSVRRLRRAS